MAVAWAVLDRASKRPRSYCGYYGRPSKHEAVVLERPDIDAARRGGDWSQGMDGEGIPGDATINLALYWRQIYSEILVMEEKVLDRIRHLMETQSDEARREIELTNVPVVVAQAERFRQRLGYWEARIVELDGPKPTRTGPTP